MENTLIIERTETKRIKREIELPYYAKFKEYSIDTFVAITGNGDNLSFTTYSTLMPSIGGMKADKLPEDHEQISEAKFIQAFDKAIAAIEQKRRDSCPNYSPIMDYSHSENA